MKNNLKKLVGVGSDRSGQVKEKSREFLKTGHPIPDGASSPFTCGNRSCSQADQLCWPHLLPSLYFPESLFSGPKQGAGVSGPRFSPCVHWCYGGTGAALPVPVVCLQETQGVLTKAFCLRLGRLSSSSTVVQEITMNKRLPVARYFRHSLHGFASPQTSSVTTRACPILAGWHQILPFPRRSNPGSPSLSLLQPCCSSCSASGRAPRLPIVSARVPHVQLSNTCLSPSWGHPGGFPPPTRALEGSSLSRV